MRKLFVLICFICISVAMNAQLQNKILGFTLGVSTQSAVITSLKHQGYKVTKELSGSYAINDVRFGGEYWAYASFAFYQNKLLNVYFSNCASEVGLSLIDSQFDLLKMRLQKYEKYILDELTNNERIWCEDNKTRLILDKSRIDGDLFVVLQYESISLWQKKNQAINNEL